MEKKSIFEFLNGEENQLSMKRLAALICFISAIVGMFLKVPGWEVLLASGVTLLGIGAITKS